MNRDTEKPARLTPVGSAPYKRIKAIRSSGSVPILVLLIFLAAVAIVIWRYGSSPAPTTSKTVLTPRR